MTIQNSVAGLLMLSAVLLLSAFAAPTLSAADRTPADAEQMYESIGDQLFCICGCREKLLSCSHNVCSAKDEERKYLRELAQNPKFDEAGIKDAMVTRFGKGVLQVPEDSNLYPILFAIGGFLIMAFGTGFWVVTRHGKPEAPLEADSSDPEMDARIEEELKELD